MSEHKDVRCVLNRLVHSLMRLDYVCTYIKWKAVVAIDKVWCALLLFLWPLMMTYVQQMSHLRLRNSRSRHWYALIWCRLFFTDSVHLGCCDYELEKVMLTFNLASSPQHEKSHVITSLFVYKIWFTSLAKFIQQQWLRDCCVRLVTANRKKASFNVLIC